MRINNSITAFQNSSRTPAPAGLSKEKKDQSFSERLDSSTSAITNPSKEIAQSNAPSDRLAEIRKQYDLRSISYTELQSMTKELLACGGLQESEYLDFLPPSQEYSNVDGSRNADWNRPMDHIGDIEDKISFMKKYCPGLSTTHLEYMLELKMKFAHIA